jgi:sugar O-acyltransferase (sialic acid O-acetyltransferase NeuD family)
LDKEIRRKYIVGAGDLSREIFTSFFLNESPNSLAFIDDKFRKGDSFLGHKVAGGMQDLASYNGNFYFGLSSPSFKQKLHQTVESNPLISWPSIIHPSSQILGASSISISDGVIISPGTIMTCDIEIGFGVFFNLSCTVGHNAKIGAYSSIMPSVNISGGVEIGERVYVGSGATILPRIKVGNDVVIGAGALVNKDVPSGVTVVGVPARILRK